MSSFVLFKDCWNSHKIQILLIRKVLYKSKTTWGVGIAQLTHHSIHGGGKNPHREPRGELIAQYRLPMSFRYISYYIISLIRYLMVDFQRMFHKISGKHDQGNA